MHIFKNFAAAVEQDMARHRARVEQLIKENQELLAKPIIPDPDYLDWDYEPSGISSGPFGKLTNGDLGS